MSEIPFAVLGRVVTPEGILDDGAVVVEGGSIAWVGHREAADGAGWGAAVERASAPAPGTLVLPGLVDIHNHGGGGVGFPEARTADEVRTAIAEHRKHGTTSLVASLVTATPDELRACVATLADVAEAGDLAGIHLEGPFISPHRCGAQNPTAVQAPDADLTRELIAIARGHLVTMTIAPELAGAEAVVETLAEGGALPSYGHTDASAVQTRLGIEHGERTLAGVPPARRRSARPTVTHLFNGMRPLRQREPGPIAACLAAAARGHVVVELIGDGTHVSIELVRDVFTLVGAQGIALVTDALSLTGLPDGPTTLGGLAVTVRDGVARLTDGGALAGGTAHLLDVVRTTVAGGVPLSDAVRSAATTPAEVLGDHSIGALEAGRRADVLVTDADLRVHALWRRGTRHP